MRENNRNQIVVAGLECHISVAQTVMDLLDEEFDVACAPGVTGESRPGVRIRRVQLHRHPISLHGAVGEAQERDEVVAEPSDVRCRVTQSTEQPDRPVEIAVALSAAYLVMPLSKRTQEGGRAHRQNPSMPSSSPSIESSSTDASSSGSAW